MAPTPNAPSCLACGEPLEAGHYGCGLVDLAAGTFDPIEICDRCLGEASMKPRQGPAAAQADSRIE